MRMGCAECDCVMDRGFRVVACKDPLHCCCGQLLTAPDPDASAASTENGPRSGL